jgi:hypothetical protein
MLIFSGYEGYPRQHFEDDNTVIFVEGLIYNKSDFSIENSLRSIAKSYTENSEGENLIKEFIDGSDGDFNALIYFKRLDEFIIFNDRWGRLPSYYYHDEGLFVLSRELEFILNFIPCIEFDKISMVEFLSFEYILGDKTLIKNVHKVNPSCTFFVKFFDDMLTVDIKRLFDVNFEQSSETPSKEECIQRCSELFLQSVSARVNKIREKKCNMTVDLSGGYDTRTVLAGLSRVNAEVDCYTDDLVTGNESEYAAKIAALYNKEVIRARASHDINLNDMRRITYMTDCTVNGWTALSTYNDSLQRTKQTKSMSVKFMGFGGEFIRHPYKKSKGNKTITRMVRDGFFTDCINIENACSIINLDEQIYYNHLTNYFDKYPEATLTGKIKHLYFEYYNTLVGAGENRHRMHFWTVEPLWSKDLFTFEMKCIQPKYIGYAFFREFMRSVDPKLLTVPIYTININLDSRPKLAIATLINNLKIFIFANKYAHKPLYDLARKIRRHMKKVKTTKKLEIEQALLDSYRSLRVLASYYSEKGIREFIKNEHREYNLYQLFTLLLYFKEIENKYIAKIHID